MVSVVSSLFFCILALFLFLFTYKRNVQRSAWDSAEKNILEEKTRQIEQANEALSQVLARVASLEERKNDIIQSTLLASQQAKEQIENQKSISESALKDYRNSLSIKYQESDDEYKFLENNLSQAYAQKQSEILLNLEQETAKLEKIKSTRAAAIKAQQKEKEIKEKLSFYCLQLSDADKEDIRVLNNIKSRLNKPRVLSMLIWSTFYQKQMTSLCNNVLGVTPICGIYKITNQKDNACYIGQSLDVSTRFKNHAKAGLGIDAPAGNKLYAAMQDYGLESFSWELLEACPQQDLNSKEKYYIDLYQSYDYGYNSNKGNSR